MRGRGEGGCEGESKGDRGKDEGSLTIPVLVVTVNFSPKYLLRSSDPVTFTFHHFLYASRTCNNSHCDISMYTSSTMQ